MRLDEHFSPCRSRKTVVLYECNTQSARCSRTLGARYPPLRNVGARKTNVRELFSNLQVLCICICKVDENELNRWKCGLTRYRIDNALRSLSLRSGDEND